MYILPKFVIHFILTLRDVQYIVKIKRVVISFYVIRFDVLCLPVLTPTRYWERLPSKINASSASLLQTCPTTWPCRSVMVRINHQWEAVATASPKSRSCLSWIRTIASWKTLSTEFSWMHQIVHHCLYHFDVSCTVKLVPIIQCLCSMCVYTRNDLKFSPINCFLILGDHVAVDY